MESFKAWVRLIFWLFRKLVTIPFFVFSVPYVMLKQSNCFVAHQKYHQHHNICMDGGYEPAFSSCDKCHSEDWGSIWIFG